MGEHLIDGQIDAWDANWRPNELFFNDSITSCILFIHMCLKDSRVQIWGFCSLKKFINFCFWVFLMKFIVPWKFPHIFAIFHIYFYAWYLKIRKSFINALLNDFINFSSTLKFFVNFFFPRVVPFIKLLTCMLLFLIKEQFF